MALVRGLSPLSAFVNAQANTTGAGSRPDTSQGQMIEEPMESERAVLQLIRGF